MHIDLLRIRGLRNLSSMEIQPVAGINLIHGKNASGKTSLLEAIYLSARGRSFRGQRVGPLIQHGKEALEIFTRLRCQGGRERRIGIRRGREETEVHLDGARIRRLSQLAQALPLQIITPKSFEILERGARYRRRFLDWGLFHVEPGYLDSHLLYQRALRQRNAALQSGSVALSTWTHELVERAEELVQARQRYLERLSPHFQDVLDALGLGGEGFRIHFSSGIPKRGGLKEVLERTVEEDIRRGFTYHGPHRADFRIQGERGSAFDVASGGQKRLLVAALTLAQMRLAWSHNGEPPVLLLDDLPAEFDRENRGRVLALAAAEAGQVFVTATEPELIPSDGIEVGKAFHVKRGSLQD